MLVTSDVTPDSPEHIELTEVGNGDAFVIQVKDLLGSGYLWLLSGLPVGICLSDVESPVQPETDLPVEEILWGGESSRTFCFISRQVGRHRLTFDLVRPWLPNDVLKRVYVSLVVK